MGCKIFDNCQKYLAKILQPPQDYADTSESLASLNQCLGEIGETPVTKHKLQQTKYPKQKIKKIATAMQRVMIHDESSGETDDEGEIIEQLKERFRTTTKNCEKGPDSNYSAK